MSRISSPRVFHLGDLASARGNLDPVSLKARDEVMARGRELMSLPSSYAPYRSGHVICIDDRLDGAAGLAGGALSQALMDNYFFGGRYLSYALCNVRLLGIYLSLHAECGALRLVANGFVQRRLTNVNAAGYRFLAGLGHGVPMATRAKIATWARGLPADFVDLARSQGMVDEVLAVRGPHRAGFVGVSLADGYGFSAHEELERETGMRAFRFDPNVAFREANRIITRSDRAAEAAHLAQVFTAEVLLELGGPRLIGSIYG